MIKDEEINNNSQVFMFILHFSAVSAGQDKEVMQRLQEGGKVNFLISLPI